MTKKIFRSFMVSAAAVLLAAVAIVMTCLYSYFASVQENQLQDQLQLAAAAVETQGRDYLNKLTADRYRLTWIAPDGAVLCDTKRDAESLENHGDRTEVGGPCAPAPATPPAIPAPCWKKPATMPAGCRTARCCAFPSAGPPWGCCCWGCCRPFC